MAQLSFALLVALAACTIADPVSLKPQLKTILSKFGARLYRETVLDEPKVNTAVTGPLVHVDLTALLYATSGTSYDQLKNGLFVPSIDFAKNAYTEWYKDYTPPKDVHTHVSRKIYVKKINKPISNKFVEGIRTFGLKVEAIDFSDSEAAANNINTYVNAQTHSQKDLVNAADLNKDTELVWVNSVHFKALFNDVYMKPTTFHLADSTTVNKETMFFSGTYRYQNNEEVNAKLIEIPLYDDAFLYIALPTTANGLADLEKKAIASNVLIAAGSQMVPTKVNVKLPVFDVVHKTDLKKILSKLDISDIFNNGLTEVYENEALSVSNAYSSVAVEFNAGTTVGQQNFQGDEEFFIDRPFLWTVASKEVKMLVLGSYWG